MRRIYGPLALLVFASAVLGLATGCPFLKTWFYLFAWWSYIFFLDWLNLRLKGTSRLYSDPKGFLRLSLASIFLWLVFEWFNLFLKNWAYLQVPSSLWVRWLGYTLAFATVLPGIFETYDLLEHLWKRPLRIRPLSTPLRWFPFFAISGLLCALLPLAYPHYFFPLVWAWGFLLLEPFNYILIPSASLLKDLEEGTARRPALLLLSGLICGFFWECWNYWAGTKWIYTLPWAWLMKIKLFEMPLAGYLGFPPFALECWSMWIFLHKELQKKWVIFIIVLFSITMFHALDLHTVLKFQKSF